MSKLNKPFITDPFANPFLGYPFSEKSSSHRGNATTISETRKSYLDTLLKERIVRIEGSASQTKKIYTELVEVVNHDHELFHKVVTLITRRAKFLLIKPLSVNVEASVIHSQTDNYLIELQLVKNPYLHLLERPDSRIEIGTTDIHSHLVHELGHITKPPPLFDTRQAASGIWKTSEEERVITRIENHCLRQRGKFTRIMYNAIDCKEDDYEKMSLADKNNFLFYPWGRCNF